VLSTGCCGKWTDACLASGEQGQLGGAESNGVDPGNRFNAYDDLFFIKKEEKESLQTLINRVETAISKIRELCPSDFTLEKLDDELASMACITALPERANKTQSSCLKLKSLGITGIALLFYPSASTLLICWSTME